MKRGVPTMSPGRNGSLSPVLSQGSFKMVQSPVGDPGHRWKEPLEQFRFDQGLPHTMGSSMLSPGPGAG